MSDVDDARATPRGGGNVVDDLVPSDVELRSIVDSCRRITASARSCLTFSRDEHGDVRTASDDDENDEATFEAAVREEVRAAAWLDGTIAEHEAVLAVGRDRGSRSDAPTRDRRRRRHRREEIDRLRRALFEETVRREREAALVHRVNMARGAAPVAFPEARPVTAGEFLAREALRERDDLVLSVLRHHRRAAELTERTDATDRERTNLEARNADTRRRLEEEEEEEDARTTTDGRSSFSLVERGRRRTTNSSSHELERARKENAYYTEAFSSLLAVADTSWYEDKRLYAAVQKIGDMS